MDLPDVFEVVTIEVLIVCSERIEMLNRAVKSIFSAAAGVQQVSVKIRILLNAPMKLTEQSPSVSQLTANDRVELIWHHGDRLKPGDARNLLIQNLQAPWAFFIDDDAFPRKDLFLNFLEILKKKPELVLLGGPNLTPKESNPIQLMTGAVLESFWGTLHSQARYFPTGEVRAAKEAYLSSCNLFVRQDILRANPYPEHYRTAEEAYFLSKVITLYPDQCFYDPNLVVYHHRRGDWMSFAKQVFGYANGRGQMVSEGLIESPWHFVPSAGLVSFVILGPFAFARPYVLSAFLFYSTATFWFASELCRKLQRPDRFFAATLAYVVLHLSYALGFLAGVSRHFILAIK